MHGVYVIKIESFQGASRNFGLPLPGSDDDRYLWNHRSFELLAVTVRLEGRRCANGTKPARADSIGPVLGPAGMGGR
jgi:hypothetical protein